MKLPDIPADGIAQPARGHSRTVRLLALVLIAAAGLAAFGARAALADVPTVQLSFDNSSIPAGGTVTMTATVTSTVAAPTGTVSFVDAASPSSPLAVTTLLPAAAPNTSTAQFVASALAARTYSIFVSYTPDFTAFLAGISAAQSLTQTLTVGSTTTTHNTQVVLTTPALTVDSTTPVVLTATVSEIGGTGIPAGTVSFVDTISGSPIPLGSGAVTLVGGVAQLTVPNFAAGPHQIVASYNGSASDNSSSSPPLLLNSHAPVDSRVTTTTTVVVSPSTIASGDSAVITATIVQTNPTGTTQPPSGTVTFTSDSALGNNVYLGSAPLGSAPTGMTAAANQAIISTSGWQAADYTITASYFGDIYDKQSSGAIPFSVLPARTQTVIGYSGDTSAELGHSATFAATVTDQAGSPLSDRTVTFTLGAQSCSDVSDETGYASCSLVVTQAPGGTTVGVSVPRDLETQGGTLNVNFTVTPQATAVSAGYQPGPSTTTLTGTLLTDTGAPLAGQLLTLTLAAETCTATTNASGFASCPVASLTGPPVTLAAAFAGTALYVGSTDAKTVTLSTPTSLAYTGTVTGDYHDPAALSAVLEDVNGAPLSGQLLTFTLGSQTCTATTGSDGSASCAITVSQPSGSYAVAVSFAGQGLNLPSNDSDTFIVTQEQTTLTATAVSGASTTALSATLLEDGVTPIAGRTVTLSLGSATCTATTNAAGLATCSVATPTGQTSAALAATFAGDTYYLAASFGGTVTLQTPTTVTYTGETSDHTHDLATLSAKLVRGPGNTAFSGQQVTFTLGAQSCHATTSSSGVATCFILLVQQPATYPLTVSFAGGNGYQASTATSSFVVTREETNVYVGVSGPVLNQNRLTLTGVLVEDGILPIANRTLTMKLGSLSCTGITNIFGSATCTLSATAPLGPTTSSVTFAGDAWYLPATDSEPALLYAHGPGGGSFVIGDRDDDGSVYFWGSQWSKHNSMSGGGGSSSFKGYANHGVTSCGKSWSADPGNSSTPPSGALPAYMDVVVASSASKSGSSIAGNSVHIVIVKTDAGYAGNPGHDGTGTVVATVS